MTYRSLPVLVRNNPYMFSDRKAWPYITDPDQFFFQDIHCDLDVFSIYFSKVKPPCPSTYPKFQHALLYLQQFKLQRSCEQHLLHTYLLAVVVAGVLLVVTGGDVTVAGDDVVLTGGDVVLTGSDVVLTDGDVVLTGGDVVLTGGIVVLTLAGVVFTVKCIGNRVEGGDVCLYVEEERVGGMPGNEKGLEGLCLYVEEELVGGIPGNVRGLKGICLYVEEERVGGMPGNVKVLEGGVGGLAGRVGVDLDCDT